MCRRPSAVDGVGCARSQAGRSRWCPLHDGWRCPNCTRAYQARIERLARRLIAEHEQQRWVHAEEHTAWTECVCCDVIRRASAMLLDGTREGCQ
jgi:hypothetical protein